MSAGALELPFIERAGDGNILKSYDHMLLMYIYIYIYICAGESAPSEGRVGAPSSQVQDPPKSLWNLADAF